MNYGGSHHFSNLQGNDQSRHRLTVPDLNVAPPMPSNLWPLIPLNIDSSDGVMHLIRTRGRLPYPPPPDGPVAHFMAFNMSFNRMPTAPQVNGNDIVLQFDNTQAIDPGFSTGVVANPEDYSYEANLLANQMNLSAHIDQVSPPPPDGPHFMAFNMSFDRMPTAPQVNGDDIVLQFDNTQAIDPSFSTGVVANSGYSYEADLPANQMNLSAHIGQVYADGNLTPHTPTQEPMIQDVNPPFTNWEHFSTPSENSHLNSHGYSSDSDGENQTGGGKTATTANHDFQVFTVKPSIVSYPNIFTKIYHQDKSFTSVAEFLHNIPPNNQFTVYSHITNLKADELVEGLYYYDPKLDIGGGTTSTFRISRFAEDERVVQAPALQFAWNKGIEGSYVECRICCRRIKLSKLFHPVNWNRHKEHCVPSPEKEREIREIRCALKPDDQIDQAYLHEQIRNLMAFPPSGLFGGFLT